MNVVVALCGVALVLAGSSLAITVIVRARHALSTRTWAMTLGEVICASVNEHHDSEGSVTYSPYIKYRYEVAGRRYESDHWSYKSTTGLRADAIKVVKRFVPGEQVTVHFDPAQPEHSVLELGASPGSYGITITVGVLLLLLGIAVIARAL